MSSVALAELAEAELANLCERVRQSELGSQWFNDPLMQQDVWPLTALGFDEEYCRVHGTKNVYFTRITLPWLKYLAKLTVKARAREKCSASQIISDTRCLTQLNKFLLAHGYSQPAGITESLPKAFVLAGNMAQHLVICNAPLGRGGLADPTIYPNANEEANAQGGDYSRGGVASNL